MLLTSNGIPDESVRLAALRRLRILDTPREERFDRLTRLAARLLNVPIALVSLIDSNRQWFKSRIGMDVSETSLELSFCVHALGQKEPMIVTDARNDRRFAHNAFVTGLPGIRFYMGQPVTTPDGHPVGTLCVVDTKPRQPSAAEIQTLKDLAELVQRELNAVTAEEAFVQLQETQRELAAQKAKFEAFIENSPCVIFMKDEQGRNVFMNRRGEEVFGFRRGEAFGKRDVDWMDAEMARLSMENDRKVFATGRVIDEIEEVLTHDGSIAHWLVVKFPFTDPDGRRLLGGVALDVTATMRAEAAQREARAAAEQALSAAKQANEMKSQFLANMSHEVRTPLHGIMGVMEMLEETRLSEEQQPLVEMVQASALTLLAIVNDILDFSKVEAGCLELHPQDFVLRDVLGEVVGCHMPRAREKGIAIETSVQDGVPSLLEGDAGRLKQVLGNLVSNSVKFSDRGVIIVRVERAVPHLEKGGKDAGERLRLKFSVSDDGIGIAPEAHARIFEPFAQADGSTTRRFAGTGLGLAIARQLVDLMGGYLEVVSVPGEGSTFHFEAAFGQVLLSGGGPDVNPAAPLLESMGGALEHDFPILRVLLAEDSTVSTMLALHQLEKLPCEVDAVTDGQSAVALWREKRHDLVLMDCHMPALDGYQAALEIRRLEGPERRTLIFAVTAHALEGEREHCMASGMDDLLSKPFRLEQLGAIIHAASYLLNARQADGPPEISPAAVAALREESPDGALVRTMADVWSHDWPEIVAEMEAAAERKDDVALAAIAHKLKGGAANFGAVRLQQICRLIGELCRERLSTFAISLLPTVKEEASRVQLALEYEAAVTK